ncbi:MAG: pyrroloquinoline-quinone synthase PqqC [Planctomycetota bacterium]
MTEMLTPDVFAAQLRAVGVDRYHHLHPVHKRMNAGDMTPYQIRTWVANRYCYQRSIPVKDAAIISNCPIRDVRRIWLHRITDHDGITGTEGGIEAWLRLAEACGLTRDEILDERHVLPGVRFAVDAYVNFARQQPWPVAVASSLTELFAPDLMSERLAAFQRYYTWVPEWGFDYFKSRVTRAKSDSEEGLELTLKYCATHELQHAALAALRFKCDVLWSLLDAMQTHFDLHPEQSQ